MKHKPKCVQKLIEYGKRHHTPYCLMIALVAVLLFFHHLGCFLKEKLQNLFGKKRRKQLAVSLLGAAMLCICIFFIYQETDLLGVKKQNKTGVEGREVKKVSEEISGNTTQVVLEQGSKASKEDNTANTKEASNSIIKNPETQNTQTTSQNIQTSTTKNTNEAKPAETSTKKNSEQNKDNKDNKDNKASDYKPKKKYNGNPYYISVNRLENCVTIYKSDKKGRYSIPVKAMRCSTGGKNTPLGVYEAGERYPFRALFYGVYGQYAVRIVNDILFHSSSYDSMSKNTLIATEFNRLGKSVSHGCIRLTVEDAKWIYDNCAYGTIVEIYEDKVSGPLGKSEVIKIPKDSVWDPTDPDVNNPWISAKPNIKGVKNLHVRRGTSIDLLKGIQAVDSCGNDITKEIQIKGKYSLQVAGVYEITYTVKDLLGRKATRKATITVV